MTLNKKKKDVNKITILTINYNVAKNLNKLIDSLILIDPIIDEIIVIDNNSVDSKEIIKTNKTKIILNKSNLGFAKAVNQGIKIAKSNYILLINPDCYIENTTILKTFKLIISDKKIGAIGGKIKKPNTNEYQQTANSKIEFLTGIFEFTNFKKIFKNNYFSKKFWIDTTNITNPIQVESLCGAYIIIRKKLNNKLNLFDERYFLYMEDVDFGNKINRLGYKVIYDPQSEITHIGGKSSKSKYNIVLKAWYKSRILYFQKHFNYLQSSLLTLIFTIEEYILILMHKIKNEPTV